MNGNEHDNNSTYFLIETRSNGNDFKPKQVFLLQLVQENENLRWTTSRLEVTNSLYSLVCMSLEANFELWMDVLGRESAEAQKLKQPITSSEILKNGALKPASPVKYNDDVFVVLSLKCNRGIFPISNGTVSDHQSNQERIEPIAFLRMGKRPLFLSTEEQLVLVDDSLAALDFYTRVQRNGLGLLMLTHAMDKYGVPINKLAFDRPTDAMLSFLRKHFSSLGQPTFHHNRFVTFPGFFG